MDLFTRTIWTADPHPSNRVISEKNVKKNILRKLKF